MEKHILKWNNWQLDFSDGPLVMGVLNITPDSFSDGGEFVKVDKAVDHALAMIKDGAAIIDVGPESSRPGAKPVSQEDQISRAIPVIQKLAGKISAPISIDTPSVEVAGAALKAGAGMINDISGAEDEDMIELAVKFDVPIALMHMQGTPGTMQDDPVYENVVEEVLEFLLERAAKCRAAGMNKEMIFIDPGIGFGKTLEHNIRLMKNLHKFSASGYRILLGASRKRFLGEITGKENPGDRLAGTLASTAIAAMQKVGIVRVHDVAENFDMIKCMNRFNS